MAQENGSTKSLRDRIRAAQDRTHQDVEVPEWGVTLRVFSMSGLERAESMERYVNPESGQLDIKSMYPALLIATCHDPTDDSKVFEKGDTWLIEKNAGALERVAQVAIELSGLRPSAKDDALKNS